MKIDIWTILIAAGAILIVERLLRAKTWTWLANLNYNQYGNRRIRWGWTHFWLAYLLVGVVTFTHCYAKYPQTNPGGEYSPAVTGFFSTIAGAAWPIYGLTHISSIFWEPAPRTAVTKGCTFTTTEKGQFEIDVVIELDGSVRCQVKP